MNITWDDLFLAIPDVDQGSQRFTGEYIQNYKEAFQERISLEHNFNTGELAPQGDHGVHLHGSAKIFYGETEPTLRPDGITPLSAIDAGRLWYDTLNNAMNSWSGTAWVVSEYTLSSLDVNDLTVNQSLTIGTSCNILNGTGWSITGYDTSNTDKTGDEIFQILAPLCPNVDDAILCDVSGLLLNNSSVNLFYGTCVRTSATQITLHGFSFPNSSSVAIVIAPAELVITEGNTSEIYRLQIRA